MPLNPVNPHMDFTSEQNAAFSRIEQWLRNPTAPQVFRLFGYAGTGKTTMAREMARGQAGVVFGAFTGKAASVMRAKGCHDASTIHAMIYRRVSDDITGRPIFVLNDDGPAARASLIIIDECSMVDRRLGEHLLSFGRRVLVLGDPAQLPPVQGAGFFTAADPDVLLTEIHRQTAGSPIIELADRVRRGGGLKPSQDRGSRILDARQLDADTVLGADQISSFSGAGYLMPRRPQPRSYFF